MIYFISDTHFYHNNIIKYCQRPFRDAVEMNSFIIDNWNSTVKENDIVYHLGDFALGRDKSFNKKEYYKSLLNSLNGKKILIRGNHDKESIDFYKAIGFEEVYDYYILNGLLLTHYPLEINEYLDNDSKNYIYKLKNIYKNFKLLKTIHGHTHNRIVPIENHINVSVENINYTPISIEKIMEKTLF